MTSEPYIQTVQGAIAPEQIGFTLPMEHVYLRPSPHTFRINEEDILASELEAYTAAGGTCIVDATPAQLGREPERLRALSKRTGVAIVMATGWYTEPFPPEDRLDIRTTDDIAEQMIREISDGVGDSGIRAGIIGEFGPVGNYFSALDERIQRASARAHKATGVPLLTHAYQCPVGLAELDLFEEEGVDPRRVSIGHCDTYPVLEYWRELAVRGAFVELDNIALHTPKHLEHIIHLVQEMIELGFSRQLLFSQDVGPASELQYFGGSGFNFVSEHFVPALLDAGVSEESVIEITVDNPRRFLTFAT